MQSNTYVDHKLILILGPARCGKSIWAEQLAATTGRSVFYLATAREDPEDFEWMHQIEEHRRRRPANWLTIETPLALTTTIDAYDQIQNCLLIDSLGCWVANLINLTDEQWNTQMFNLIERLHHIVARIIIVAEEAGWGVIPAEASGRRFRDRLGTLIRHLGPHCSATYLITGGFVLDLKLLGVPLNI